MRKNRNNIPKPPCGTSRMYSFIQEGIDVGMIWLLDERGRGAIETQYVNASRIMDSTGVSRATAYRIIAKQRKRYWLIDYTKPEEPSCCMVIPVAVIEGYTPSQAGNPNFTSGIYQQNLARRLRHRRA